MVRVDAESFTMASIPPVIEVWEMVQFDSSTCPLIHLAVSKTSSLLPRFGLASIQLVKDTSEPFKFIELDGVPHNILP